MIAKSEISLSDAFYSAEEPFLIFEIDNFFSEDFYNRLYDSFPEEELFTKEYLDKGKKKYISSKDKAFENIINSQKAWCELKNFFLESDTVNSFFNIYLRGVQGRPIYHRFKWKVIPQPSNNKSFLYSAIKKARRILAHLKGERLVYVALEFSFLKDKCYIPPHTDVSSKLISLLVYFPDKDHHYSSGGTEFYISKKGKKTQYGWKAHMLNNIDTDKFFDVHESFYVANFTKNKLVGFVKTAYSWHGLRPINLPQGVSRKSIGINYYLY